MKGNMFDIITFGSASWDVFLKPENNFQVAKNKKEFTAGKGICFNLGAKVDVEKIYFSSGGGGTNTAATFSNQGFNTAFCGKVGDDISGREIIKDLEKRGINVSFVLKTKRRPTNYSVVISTSSGDRTILVYRGASELLSKNEIPWQKLRAKWFYLAPLSGKLSVITEEIINFARKAEIKIALNPGNSQLLLPSRILRRILKKIDILFLNQEEASLLSKISYRKEMEIFKKINKMCPGIVIMTRGPKPVMVSDKKYIYSVKPPKIKVLDSTGAGDSFASGFISGFIKSSGDIEYAICLALANASSCLKRWGAKNGLLKKDEKLKKVKVLKKYFR